LKREKEVEHRKKAGKLGGIASAIKRKQVLANGSKSKQIQPENVNVNVKENIISKDIPPDGESLF